MWEFGCAYVSDSLTGVHMSIHAYVNLLMQLCMQERRKEGSAVIHFLKTIKTNKNIKHILRGKEDKKQIEIANTSLRRCSNKTNPQRREK